MLNVLDLFSGIGGFSLGLERTGGFRTVAFCEIDAYCQRVLRKHWPDVPIYSDVRTLPVISCDVICGGFPCQPFSSAARGRHTAENLWPEMLCVIRRARPDWVIGENVARLDRVALDQVVLDLEAIGYTVAPTFEIPACAVGHDHWRPRLWILAHADRDCKPSRAIDAEVAELSRGDRDPGRLGAPHGLSGRMDRLHALGNAIVPQIPELIGRAILAAEAKSLAA